MPKFPKPWYRKSRKAWFVTFDGQQIPLGPDKDEALHKYHTLMVRPPASPKVSMDTIVAIFDAYLEWWLNNRSPDTYRWYQDRLSAFAKHIGHDLLVSDLKPYHVTVFFDGMKHSSTTKRNYIAAIKRAVEQGLLEKSPVAHMKKPKAGNLALDQLARSR